MWNDVGGFAAAGALTALPKGLVASLASSIVIGSVAAAALTVKKKRDAAKAQNS